MNFLRGMWVMLPLASVACGGSVRASGDGGMSSSSGTSTTIITVATSGVTATEGTSSIVVPTGTTGIVTTTTSSSVFSSTAIGTSTTGTGGGTGGNCYAPPGPLFPEDGGTGVYCAFSAVDGGPDLNCALGQHCCEPPQSAGMASTCVPGGTACSNVKSVDVACEGTPDCAGHAGTICCGQGTILVQAPQPGCAPDGGTLGAYPYASEFYGTACQATCTTFGDAGPGFQVCSKDSECATGTCVAIRPRGNSLGYCAPGS